MNDMPGPGAVPTLHPDWFSEATERTIDSRVPFVPRGRPGLAAPLVYDVTERALRQREMNFAAKRLVDMAFVSELDWADALARLRWRGVAPTGGLDAMPDAGPRKVAPGGRLRGRRNRHHAGYVRAHRAGGLDRS